MEVFIYMRIKNVSTSGSFKNGGSTAGSSKRANELFAIKLLDNNAGFRSTSLVRTSSSRNLHYSSADLALNLSRFDAAKAKCTYDRDKQKLLAVIESSFGTTAPFNQLVLEVLNARFLGLKEASRSSPSNRRFSGRARATSFNSDTDVDVEVTMQV